jgi:hypothetical protein
MDRKNPPPTGRLERWRRSKGLRVLVGLGLVIHGLGHAVFPLRGAAGDANLTTAKVLSELAWILAMTGFVAGGCGLAGAWPLRRFWRACVAVAVPASVIAFATMRRLDVMLGPVLDVVALAAFYGWGNTSEEGGLNRGPIASTWWRRFRAGAATVVAVGVTGYVVTCAATRSWHSQWGVEDEELELDFPGDAPNRDPTFEVNHGITIAVPPSAVWPWLVQIGQDRAGFYSYERLENLFGLRIRNAERIHAEWQQRAVGDLVRATPPDWMGGSLGGLGWRISHLQPEHALVLDGWGAFVLAPLPDERTRLFVRSKVTGPNIPVWAAALTFATFELPHFIMQRQMLRGIKSRAESCIEPAPEMAPGRVVAGH